jgi:hypothetical protein
MYETEVVNENNKQDTTIGALKDYMKASAEHIFLGLDSGTKTDPDPKGGGKIVGG